MSELLMARAQAAGSTLIHRVPILRPLGRRLVDLTDPGDLLLRWRIGTVPEMYDLFWAARLGSEGANKSDPATWAQELFGANRAQVENIVNSDMRPAFAYQRLGGAVIMVGTQEITPEDPFLQPMNDQGVPNPDGALLGVVGRTGEDPWRVAIGAADASGTKFVPLPTFFVRPMDDVPPGLHRV